MAEKLTRQMRFWSLTPFLAVLISISSCFSTRLKPVVQSDSLQPLTKNDLNKLNGDYEIFSVDSSFRTLSEALAFTKEFNFEALPKANDRVSLLVVDQSHIKATVYKDDKVVKTKVLKGQVSQNYFRFKLTHLSFYLVLNFYSREEGRIGLLKNGDLTLDTNGGGAILLVVMPTFGDGAELYSLVFKRKK